MSRVDVPQLNVRSRFARDRAALLAQQTGMTSTEVVEEALRAYVPPMLRAVPTKFICKSGILVRPSEGVSISLEQANAVLEEDRDTHL
jgi:hypothetical protein